MNSEPQHKSDNRSFRKLAAILFADVVGYTALMQANEKKAAAILRQFQSSIRQEVKNHNGRIVNFYGDGALIVFETPVEAIQYAVQLQQLFLAEAVPVRMGIHSGTVVFDGDQVYGDSVNITSRIESMGIKSSVLFSERVRRDIKKYASLDDKENAMQLMKQAFKEGYNFNSWR